MFIRLLLTISLSFFVIYGINYFDIADLDYNFKTVAVTSIALILLRVLYYIFTKFLKIFLFIFVFLPLLALFINYIYSYLTGAPVEFMDLDWLQNFIDLDWLQKWTQNL